MKIVELVAKRALRQGNTGHAVRLVQEALRRAGHEIVVDGVFGSITRAAVERFQAANRIASDGLVGPVTGAYLDSVAPSEALPEKPLPSVLATAPWLSWMRANTGVKEIPGARSNPLILSWVKAIGAKYPTLKPNIDWYVSDATPWCGLGAGAAVGLSVPGYKPPDAPLWALNWRGAWARQLKEPALGCVMVKPRTGGGHVTLYDGESATQYFGRGANQNNQINIAAYSKKDKWTFHWPVGAPAPTQGRVRRAYANAPLNPTLA